MTSKQDVHQIIAALKDLALELGRTPTRDEFTAKFGSSRTLREYGSFSDLLLAAGFQPHQKRRITNEIFQVDLAKHLLEYKPKEVPRPSELIEKFPRCLFIPDFHAPWGDLRVIEAACRYAEIHKPLYICQVGDLYDFISHSRFPASKNIYTPREEQKAGRAQAEEMWKMLSSAAPQAKKIQQWGNHDQRPLKRILETYPEAEDFVAKMITELMTFPGVETLEDQRQELILPGNVMVLHGYLSRPGSHRDYNLGFNVVHGHLHTAHVMYKQSQGKVFWELNCGIAADIHSKAFTYTPQRSLNWSRGFGWLDEFGPRFIAV